MTKEQSAHSMDIYIFDHITFSPTEKEKEK